MASLFAALRRGKPPLARVQRGEPPSLRFGTASVKEQSYCAIITHLREKRELAANAIFKHFFAGRGFVMRDRLIFKSSRCGAEPRLGIQTCALF